MLTTVTTATPPGEFVHPVVGHDGSPPAGRALDAAVGLPPGRTGRIEVGYVAQLSSVAMLSPGAIAEIEPNLDVPRHPQGDRFDRRRPGPPFAGTPCYRALKASRKRTSL
jgi:hypothetical protein